MKGEIETLFFHYLFHLYHKEEKEFERLYEYNMIYNKKKNLIHQLQQNKKNWLEKIKKMFSNEKL